MSTGDTPDLEGQARHRDDHEVAAPSPNPDLPPRSRWVSTDGAPPGIFFGDDPFGPDAPNPYRSGSQPALGSPARSSPGPAGQPTSSDAGNAKTLGASNIGSLASAVALLPLTALALLPFWAVLNLIVPIHYGVILVSYVFTGLALYFPSTQRLMLTVFFHARNPTSREQELLEPAWQSVTEAAGIPQDRHTLVITDSPQLDAVATGGRLIAVPRLALTLLPEAELEAGLAHELGHHTGLRNASRLVALWLEAPILLFARLGMWLELAAYGLALWFAWDESFGTAIGALLGGLAIRVAGHLVPAASGAAGFVHALRRFFGRYGIYQADDVAVGLGYGDDLIDLLERMVEYQLEGEQGDTVDSALGGQALIARRIERIEEQLAA